MAQKWAPWTDDGTPAVRARGRSRRTAASTAVDRPEPGLLAATMECTVGDRRWTQSFVGRRLDDDLLERVLDDAGLTTAGFPGDRGWVRALPR